jgi:uncharacterized protein YbaP (TraB family)
MKRLASATAALALLLVAPPALADPPLWRVMGPHAEVDLFGSVHLLTNRTTWKDPALLAALSKADAVWFEIPLGDASQAETLDLIRQKGQLPAGQTLSGLLPPGLYARAAALAKQEGLPEASLQRMRPWMAELFLSLLYFQRQGASASLGVEPQINAAAPPAAARGAFETVAEQIDLFADDPLTEQVASLKQTLDDIDTDPGLYARLADDWQAGDVKGLVREVIDPMRAEDEALYQRVLVARNRRFAARIEQMARGDRRVFVVVGVGHLVGPDGVPTLLRADGLKVVGP